jgi:predicted XRE-type DNA-binding protein
MSEYLVSSGNVFQDLAFPDAEEKFAKVKLASAIYDAIQKQGRTPEEVLTILGINAEELESLINGRLRSFSREKLFSFLLALGHNLEIVVTPKSTGESKGAIAVIYNCL